VERDGKLLWIDGFLSKQTCELVLVELEYAFWYPSTVANRRPDGAVASHYISEVRTSESTDEEWFTPELRRQIREVERRLATLLDYDPLRYERWQATRYRRGEAFDYHFDAGPWAADSAGERTMTILIYLDAPQSGGGTHFKDQDIEIRAQAGRLVAWENLLRDGTRDPDMLHASMPVKRGVKTTLVTWIRQRVIRTK